MDGFHVLGSFGLSQKSHGRDHPSEGLLDLSPALGLSGIPAFTLGRIPQRAEDRRQFRPLKISLLAKKIPCSSDPYGSGKDF
jgi:hypothetical protein